MSTADEYRDQLTDQELAEECAFKDRRIELLEKQLKEFGELYEREDKKCQERIEELEIADHNSTAALVRAAQRIEELEQKLKDRETYWLEWNGRASVRNEGLEDALEKANRLATQRVARMQIMRDYIVPLAWECLIEEHPDAGDWFDEDGVPVREGK